MFWAVLVNRFVRVNIAIISGSENWFGLFTPVNGARIDASNIFHLVPFSQIDSIKVSLMVVRTILIWFKQP